MTNFKLYYISEEYIDYLRQFDTRVAYNKNKTRLYVGAVYSHEGSHYFVPLHSPKAKHKNIKDRAIDIYKINNREFWGGILII